MHLGMQRLHAPIHHLGKARDVRHVEHLEAGSASVLRVLPPVETSSMPRAASAPGKSTRPVLSETERRARRCGEGSRS